MLAAIAWGGLAAASLLIGYALANRGLSKHSVGLVMGIGTGALISAIAYELVPEEAMANWASGVAFAAGAVAFFLADRLLENQGGGDRKDISGDLEGAETEGPSGSGAAIFVGTMLDNIPESIILGMGLGLGGGINAAFLTAVFISNLPEGVAGTRNLEGSGYSRRTVFWMWAVLVLVSAAAAGVGYALVSALPTADGHVIQAFAAGAMLTMLADAMMPEAFENGGKMVGLFTVFGFLLSAALSVIS